MTLSQQVLNKAPTFRCFCNRDKILLGLLFVNLPSQFVLGAFFVYMIHG
jgi:hypothetical protein